MSWRKCRAAPSTEHRPHRRQPRHGQLRCGPESCAGHGRVTWRLLRRRRHAIHLRLRLLRMPGSLLLSGHQRRGLPPAAGAGRRGSLLRVRRVVASGLRAVVMVVLLLHLQLLLGVLLRGGECHLGVGQPESGEALPGWHPCELRRIEGCRLREGSSTAS